MNPAHLHLLLNHVPLWGAVFSLALVAGGLVRRDVSVMTAGKISLVLVGLATIPVYLTGDPAGDIVKKLPGVSRELIHTHDEAATFGLIATLVVGAFALLLLFKARERIGAHLGLLVVGLWALSVLVRVGYLGGQIQHAEIRSTDAPGTASAPASAPTSAVPDAAAK